MLQITTFIIKKQTKREAYAIGSKESQKVKGLKFCNILDLFSILCFPGCYTIGHNILIYIYQHNKTKTWALFKIMVYNMKKLYQKLSTFTYNCQCPHKGGRSIVYDISQGPK